MYKPYKRLMFWASNIRQRVRMGDRGCTGGEQMCRVYSYKQYNVCSIYSDG